MNAKPPPIPLAALASFVGASVVTIAVARVFLLLGVESRSFSAVYRPLARAFWKIQLFHNSRELWYRPDWLQHWIRLQKLQPRLPSLDGSPNPVKRLASSPPPRDNIRIYRSRLLASGLLDRPEFLFRIFLLCKPV